MNEGQQRSRLAELMQARRRELRLSARAAAQLAGIDRNTWSSAEAASRRTAEYHYAGIERALQWAPGSVDAILAGGDPTELDAQPLPAAGIRDEEVGIVLDDPDLDNRAKKRIIEIILDRRERDRAAAVEDTRRVIALFKQQSDRPA